MKLKNLIPPLLGKATLYEQVGKSDYRDLYEGEMWNAPKELLEREVRVIAPSTNKKGYLEIELKNPDYHY